MEEGLRRLVLELIGVLERPQPVCHALCFSCVHMAPACMSRCVLFVSSHPGLYVTCFACVHMARPQSVCQALCFACVHMVRPQPASHTLCFS